MTSVPHYSGRFHSAGSEDNVFNGRNNHNDDDNINLKSSIPPNSMKIRHIRSILIRNVIDEDENGLVPQSTVSDFQNDQTDVFIPKSTNLLKKGKSTHNLKAHHDLNNGRNIGIENSNTSYNLSQSIEIQKQFEFQKVNESTFFDCFYTINNFLNIENPYFISRIFPSHVELSDDLDLRIFTNSATINLFIKHQLQNWKLLKQYHLKLSLLINLGDDLSLILHHLYDINNLLLLKMSDDCYYILPNNNRISNQTINFLKLNYLRTTSSKFDNFQFKEHSCIFDQIMTMNNYSRCNHDLLSIKHELSNRIADNLNNQDYYHKLIDQTSQLHISIEILSELVNSKIKHNYQLEAKINNLKKIKSKKQERNKSLKYSSKSINSLINIAEETEKNQIGNLKLLDFINFEKSRISSRIQFIFPMKQVDNKYNFSLFDTCYPSSLIPKHRSKSIDLENNSIIPSAIISSTVIQKLTQISKSNSDRLNSMIGYISLIVLTISNIFNIPLRYPITYLGSNSYINDPISSTSDINNYSNSTIVNSNQNISNLSNLKQSSIYPLFICQNTTLAVKLTYGLFFLRKNLEQLYDVEKIAKIEEFNLLVACKIWLTCIEGYADLSNDDETNGSLQSLTDAELGTLIVDNAPLENNNNGDKLSPLLDGSLFKYKELNRHNASINSKRSNVSTVSTISVESNANLVVNEFNHKLLSEERIKHIKKHLLKGSK